MFDISKLKNCPNCDAPLNELGRCEYCGSKVYDLTDIDVRSPHCGRTYLRIRTDYGILVVPAICESCDIHKFQGEQFFYADNCIMQSVQIPYHTKISLEFMVTDDYIKIMEDEKMISDTITWGMHNTDWLGTDTSSTNIIGGPVPYGTMTTKETNYFRSDDIAAVLDAYADFHHTKKEKNAMNKENFKIKKIIFSKGATVVFFGDDTKIIVKCQKDDTYSRYAALTAAVCKKLYGGTSTYLKKFLDGKTSTIIECDDETTIIAKKEEKK